MVLVLAGDLPALALRPFAAQPELILDRSVTLLIA